MRIVSRTAISGPAVRVEDAVRRGDAGDAVGEEAARAVDRGHLGVLRVRVGDLAVARDDLALERVGVEQRLGA